MKRPKFLQLSLVIVSFFSLSVSVLASGPAINSNNDFFLAHVHAEHEDVEGEEHHHGEGEDHEPSARSMGFAMAIAQIAVLDIVFSLDSVITAVGIAEHVEVMVIAIVIAMAVMLFAAGPVGGFVERHPTVKMLALAFLILVGASLIADGLHFHIPRGYIYFAIAFSISVEGLNLWAAARRKRKREAEARAATN